MLVVDAAIDHALVDEGLYESVAFRIQVFNSLGETILRSKRVAAALLPHVLHDGPEERQDARGNGLTGEICLQLLLHDLPADADVFLPELATAVVAVPAVATSRPTPR